MMIAKKAGRSSGIFRKFFKIQLRGFLQVFYRLLNTLSLTYGTGLGTMRHIPLPLSTEYRRKGLHPLYPRDTKYPCSASRIFMEALPSPKGLAFFARKLR